MSAIECAASSIAPSRPAQQRGDARTPSTRARAAPRPARRGATISASPRTRSRAGARIVRGAALQAEAADHAAAAPSSIATSVTAVATPAPTAPIRGTPQWPKISSAVEHRVEGAWPAKLTHIAGRTMPRACRYCAQRRRRGGRTAAPGSAPRRSGRERDRRRILAEREQQPLGAEPERAERHADERAPAPSRGAAPRPAGRDRARRAPATRSGRARRSGRWRRSSVPITQMRPSETALSESDVDPPDHQQVDRPEQHRRELGQRHRRGQHGQTADLPPARRSKPRRTSLQTIAPRARFAHVVSSCLQAEIDDDTRPPRPALRERRRVHPQGRRGRQSSSASSSAPPTPTSACASA